MRLPFLIAGKLLGVDPKYKSSTGIAVHNSIANACLYYIWKALKCLQQHPWHLCMTCGQIGEPVIVIFSGQQALLSMALNSCRAFTRQLFARVDFNKANNRMLLSVSPNTLWLSVQVMTWQLADMAVTLKWRIAPLCHCGNGISCVLT